MRLPHVVFFPGALLRVSGLAPVLALSLGLVGGLTPLAGAQARPATPAAPAASSPATGYAPGAPTGNAPAPSPGTLPAGGSPGGVFPGPDMTHLLLALTDQPASHSGFTFDRSMLQFAQNLLEQNGIGEGRAAAAVTGVSFDSFHYEQPAFYTPDAMTALIDSYKAAHWKHLVDGNQTPANSAQPKQMATDLWLHFAGSEIDGITVLTRSSLMMNVVHITGNLRPLELLKLSGHLGIPKVDPNAVMVPAP